MFFFSNLLLIFNSLKRFVMKSTIPNDEVGLFLVKYEIGGNMPGAPLFSLSLGVNTPEKAVSGVGDITQAENPPLDIKTSLTGDYTYMCTMDSCSILVVATGFPMVKWPAHGGIGPVLLPNVHLRMVLSEDWKTGTANYSYQNSEGEWDEINNATVELIK